MSLYLTELKVKTALELVERIAELSYLNGLVRERSSAYVWKGEEIDSNLKRLRGVLHEIIDRPKETENG